MRLAPMARNRPHHASTLRTSALAVACAALAGLFPGCGDVGSTPAAISRRLSSARSSPMRSWWGLPGEESPLRPRSRAVCETVDCAVASACSGRGS